MTLRGWSWDTAVGPAGHGDRPLLEALEAAIPDDAVEAPIDATGTRQRRRRRLPTHLVVTLVVAMGLWASESMRHVLAEVGAGWREGAAIDPTAEHRRHRASPAADRGTPAPGVVPGGGPADRRG